MYANTFSIALKTQAQNGTNQAFVSFKHTAQVIRIRRTHAGDLERVLACKITEPVNWVTEEKYRENLAAQSYRPEWTWIAEQGERILARAVYWGLPGAEHPLELDCLHVDPVVENRAALGAQLLSQMLGDIPHDHEPPSYQLILDNHWRDDPHIAAAVAWRMAAAKSAGLSETVERLRYEWTSASGTTLPKRSTRLSFAKEPNEAAWVELLRCVAEDSLDAETRREVTRVGRDKQARSTVSKYKSLPGSDKWWRVAHADAERVGFTMPSLYEGGYLVAYLGVVPKFRGQRFVDDILTETTHILAEEGARRIVADVDATNAPMVKAFERAGYRNFAVRIVVASPA